MNFVAAERGHLAPKQIVEKRVANADDLVYADATPDLAEDLVVGQAAYQLDALAGIALLVDVGDIVARRVQLDLRDTQP